MSAVNPFQIPSCLQRAELRQRRQERIKQIVIGSVVVVGGLLVVLLIQGCMTERARVSVAPATVVEKLSAAPERPVVEPPKSVVQPLVKPLMPAPRPAWVYVVKPGDTLSRIAKRFGTTVKALKAINGLNNDLIAIGAQLKVPGET